MNLKKTIVDYVELIKLNTFGNTEKISLGTCWDQKNHGPFLPSILKLLFQKSFQMSQKGHNPIPNIDWLHLKHILNEPK